ncbi:TonB-dependent receptor plug [Desulfatibacillum aliphaticivorans]|uniref:TonB-dependent receptor plug n=1 Tax=Desulfatibacillum aliphaticivorans TaxID=218208 RepID=B8FM15_DESAL|nr:TonB-dependent receptor [Desulfatibacillum aliphaticivorans]ACL05748.1 TonB-dependent receptor plug [Desulfatibacillum aliphaticivorans]
MNRLAKQCFMGVFALSACVCLLIQTGFAEEIAEPKTDETIVVKSTKIERKLENVTDSVTVISEYDIKSKQFTDFTEVLRFTPGVEFKQAGGPGQFSYPKMRGYGEGHFLVVIDGVKINEGLGGSVGHFLGQLDPSIVENVEILRGPQSALYGANTTAGVIAITTKGGVEGQQINFGGEYGSLDWKKAYASSRGTKDNLKYGVNVAMTDSGGVHKFETYDNQTASANMGYTLGSVELGASLTYMKTEFNSAELDESSDDCSQANTTHWAFQTPDPHNTNTYDHWIGSLSVNHTINEKFSQKAMYGWFKKESTGIDINDGFLGYQEAPYDGFVFGGAPPYAAGERVPIKDGGNGLSSNTKNQNYQFEYNFIYDANIGQNHANTLLLGYEYIKQEGQKWGRYGEAEAEAKNDSFFLNDQLLLMDETLILSGGLRFDDHETYCDQTNYKLGASYLFKSVGTTLFTNYGTSFRAPTVSNMYDPKYGNPGITPEDGWTYEGGVRQSLFGKRLNAEVCYWKSELDNIIVYDSKQKRFYVNGTGAYVNRDNGETEGVELGLSFMATHTVTVSANYTYCDSYSFEDGEKFRNVQVARNKANLDIAYDDGKYTFNIHPYYTGPRLRWNGDIEMDDYLRVDAAASVRVLNNVKLYTRLENLTDDKTQEGLGYEQPGFYGIIGVEIEH